MMEREPRKLNLPTDDPASSARRHEVNPETGGGKVSDINELDKEGNVDEMGADSSVMDVKADGGVSDMDDDGRAAKRTPITMKEP